MTFSLALNHMTTAQLRYDLVLQLASKLECVGVEFRNDLPGELFDGDAPTKVRDLAKDAGVRILALSEVKMFNAWSEEKRTETQELISVALSIGAEAISLIPRCDGVGLGNGERQANLRVALRETLPMLEEAGLLGMVEPLGFEHSSLRYKEEALDAIDGVGGLQTFKLVHDTFHHRLADETQFYAANTGIIHISGVEDPSVSYRDMQDSHRLLVGKDDRLGNVAQIRELLGAGYVGAVSYEAFSPIVHGYDNPFAQLSASIEFLNEQLAQDLAS